MLIYKNGVVVILDEEKHVSAIIRRVSYLVVSNDFDIQRYRSPLFHQLVFYGYGIL